MQRAFLSFFLLVFGLTAGVNESRAARLASVQDTIVMRLPNRATLTLTVRDAGQLRQLKDYHLDSLTTRLATYITQAEAAAKAGTTNQVTMRFYPDKDQPGQNLPEEIRITAHKPGTDGSKGPTKTQVYLNKKFGITTYNEGNGNNSFEISSKNAKPKTKEDSLKHANGSDRHHLDARWDIGLTTLVNSNSTPTLGVPSLSTWGSTYINFGLDYIQPLHYTKRTKLALTFGPEFGGNYLRLNGNDQWVQGLSTTFTERAPDAKQIDKAQLYIGTLNLPVMLRLKLYNKEDKRTLSAGIGGFGGYRLVSNTKTEYKLAGSDYNHEDKISGPLNLTNWQYGVQGEIGFHALQVFAKYNMNELFTEGKGPQTHLFTFGLNIFGF
jgi:hypothetical protein